MPPNIIPAKHSPFGLDAQWILPGISGLLHVTRPPEPINVEFLARVEILFVIIIDNGGIIKNG